MPRSDWFCWSPTVEPPGHRRPGQHGEPDGDGGRERPGGHRRLAEPAGDQKVDDEQQRHELDAGREAGGRALPPAAVRLAQVPDDDRHHHQLDLTEEQRALHRLGPEHQAGQQQRRPGPGGVPPAELAERDPDRRRKRGRAQQRDQRHQRPERQRRPRREQQRRKRRVGELDAGMVLVMPGVQVARVMQCQLPSGQVDLQVEPLQHGRHRVRGQRREVRDGSKRGHRGADDQQHAAGGIVLPACLTPAGQARLCAHRWRLLGVSAASRLLSAA